MFGRASGYTGPPCDMRDVIRKEAWIFYRTVYGVRLCWELEEPKGPKRPRNIRARPRKAQSGSAGVGKVCALGEDLVQDEPEPLQGYLAPPLGLS